jgi:hypothetical protein
MGYTLTGQLFLGCAPPAVDTLTPFPSKVESTATPRIPTPTSTPNKTYDFDVFISELEITMPGACMEGYLIPKTTDEQAFRSMTIYIIGENPEAAVKLASKFKYELLLLFDQAETDAESYVLWEQQPIEKGWGIYFFRKRSFRNIVVEAPHPDADEYTAALALDLYRALDAKALLIAGAHRDANMDGSADLTHARESIFQTVHLALFNPAEEPNDETIFLQVHGYSVDRHPNLPDVIIGYNWEKDPEKDALLSNIVQSIQENDIRVGVCGGQNYRGLCGISNVQRSATEGGIFIHIELSGTIRKDDRMLVLALTEALNP